MVEYVMLNTFKNGNSDVGLLWISLLVERQECMPILVGRLSGDIDSMSMYLEITGMKTDVDCSSIIRISLRKRRQNSNYPDHMNTDIDMSCP